MDENKLAVQEWHKKQAIENFNGTWDLIDKKDRTKEEDILMIHSAHTSRYHWGQIGLPLQFARGEWQISRVYSLLEMFESALYHATYSLKLCEENSIEDFDLAFGYEAVARSYMLNKNTEMMNKFLKLALDAAENISKEGDKQYFLSELKSINLD